MPNNEDEKGEELKENDEMEIEIDEFDDDKETKGEEILAEKIKPKNRNDQSSMNKIDNPGEDDNDVEEHIDVDGEVVLTHTVERGLDTMFHTVNLKEDDEDVYSNDKKDYKEYIRNQFDNWFEVSLKKNPWVM